jgi:hypothetical protein
MKNRSGRKQPIAKPKPPLATPAAPSPAQTPAAAALVRLASSAPPPTASPKAPEPVLPPPVPQSSPPAPRAPGEDWAQRVKEEVGVLIQQELTQGAAPPTSRTLAELQLLLDMAERISPKPRRTFLLMGILSVLGALAVVVLFSAIPLAETDVELSAKVMGFNATLTEERALFWNNPQVVSLSASRASTLQVPAQQGHPRFYNAEQVPDLGLTVFPAAKATVPTILGVERITLPLGTRFGVSATSPRDVAIDIRRPGVGLVANFKGPIQVNVSPSILSETVAPDVGNSLIVMSGDNTRIAFQTHQPAGCILCIPAPVSQLAFEGTDKVARRDGKSEISFSQIISGSLVLRDIGDKEIPLRPGTQLTLGIEAGELRSASVDDEGRVSILFLGKLNSLKTGSPGHETNLMPSYLAWFAAYPPWALRWGALALLCGLALKVLDWIREHP